jgi:hypothetical protein
MNHPISCTQKINSCSLLRAVKGDGTNGEIVIDDDVKSAFAGSSWQSCRKMIYVPRSAQKGFAVGFWPIPEAFWPDINAATLVLLFPSH